MSAMTVVGDSTPVKRCVVCGMDLSRAKRTKVPSGDYYCEACYRKQTAAIAAAAPKADAVTPLPMSSGGGNIAVLALAAALLIMIAVAVVVYLWFTSPSRRMVVVAPAANSGRTSPNSVT